MAEQLTITQGKTENGKIAPHVVINAVKRAWSAKRKWVKVAESDFEYTLGKQWDDSDAETLKSIAVKPLTINKIQPFIFMVSGIQRQNKSDYLAFPEGQEDELEADVATRLLKNMMKRTQGEHKLSQQFEDGIITGEGWLEAYLDYSYDIVSGELKLKKVSPFCILVDPNSVEYDISDARYVIKISKDLTIEQLEEIFPDKNLSNIGSGQIILDPAGQAVSTSYRDDDYKHAEPMPLDTSAVEEKVYDLVEYYYKKNVKKYIVVNTETAERFDADSQESADQKAKIMMLEGADPESIRVIKKVVPEIWLAQMVGNDVITDELAWSYPRWKNFPFIPYRAHWIQAEIKDKELLTQGLVRSLKDPQTELNKRRTQELRHLNQSANSGWLTPRDAWIDRKAVQKFGSAPGVNLEFDPQKGMPQRITPMALSSGHSQLAAQNSQDMKEISGINTDLLALNDKNQSGRAIRLRQQQGLVMIQRILDNFTETKKILGRFLLTMLGEVYTFKTAERVLGEQFLEENFLEEIKDPNTGMQTEFFDENGLREVLGNVLHDTGLGIYDVAVGESDNSETTRFSNFMMLQEMIQAGMPIPPDILIDESLLNSASKEKIKAAIQNAVQGQQEGTQNG